jgi:hypothetical protein
MAISVIMGFPLIDRAAMEIGRAFEGKYSAMRQVIPASSAVVHLVEINSKMGAVHGDKFLAAAIILRCNSRPGWYNLSKLDYCSAGVRRLVRY